jgi:hypothetical protein
VVFQYQLFTLAIIWFRQRNMPLVRQANAGFSAILFAHAYSATSMGYDSLRSFSEIQSDPPSFHSTNNGHPQVVFFWSGNHTELLNNDNHRVWTLLVELTRSHICWTYLKGFTRSRDGRGAFLKLWDHYLGIRVKILSGMLLLNLSSGTGIIAGEKNDATSFCCLWRWWIPRN